MRKLTGSIWAGSNTEFMGGAVAYPGEEGDVPQNQKFLKGG